MWECKPHSSHAWTIPGQWAPAWRYMKSLIWILTLILTRILMLTLTLIFILTLTLTLILTFILALILILILALTPIPILTLGVFSWWPAGPVVRLCSRLAGGALR